MEFFFGVGYLFYLLFTQLLPFVLIAVAVLIFFLLLVALFVLGIIAVLLVLFLNRSKATGTTVIQK